MTSEDDDTQILMVGIEDFAKIPETVLADKDRFNLESGKKAIIGRNPKEKMFGVGEVPPKTDFVKLPPETGLPNFIYNEYPMPDQVLSVRLGVDGIPIVESMVGPDSNSVRARYFVDGDNGREYYDLEAFDPPKHTTPANIGFVIERIAAVEGTNGNTGYEVVSARQFSPQTIVDGTGTPTTISYLVGREVEPEDNVIVHRRTKAEVAPRIVDSD